MQLQQRALQKKDIDVSQAVLVLPESWAEESYNLQLDDFAIQLHGPDFLHMRKTRSISRDAF